MNAKHTEHIVRGAITVNIYQSGEKRIAYGRAREAGLWYREDFGKELLVMGLINRNVIFIVERFMREGHVYGRWKEKIPL